MNEYKNFCPLVDTSGRTGLWDRVQDLYDCRTGNIVWRVHKLGAWGAVLDRKIGGSGVATPVYFSYNIDLKWFICQKKCRN